ATYGHVPLRSSAACARHFAHRDHLACSDFLAWYEEADRMKTPIARLINASPLDIAFVQNSSVALGLIAGGLDWKPGDNLVTLADEFPNQLYLSAHIAHRGVELREALPGNLDRAIDSRTRLVALSEVNYSSGYRAPVAEISRLAHARGAFVYLDGTQSTGALRIDVAASQPDALAVHAYKWMCSPTGIGFLYINSALRSQIRPNSIGWRSHRDWRNVDNLHHGAPELIDTAERYEGGGLSFGLLHSLGESVGMMLEIGPENIESRVLSLANDARVRLRNLGAEVPDYNSQIATAKFPRHNPSHLARELKSRNILVAARHGYLRVSPHFYNNAADLDALESGLRSLL
ncbi:MAG TPA: aminotransferase class V-fold PLP-dependent enzyme, partial [Bryobacteraceae bacterium]|nr:aminotransferase class V-fold PLP-dependent enzyme [Bryobacteraceae bacterium]